GLRTGWRRYRSRHRAYPVGRPLGRLSAMGPFDLPPSTPPVSLEPPQQHRGRRRTAVVIAASVALIGAGVLAVAQFASNDDSPVTCGDGHGSGTITKKDGAISISSDGDVQQSDLGAPDASVPMPSLPDMPDFGELTKCLEDATGLGK